jgi:hypothetical protein
MPVSRKGAALSRTPFPTRHLYPSDRKSGVAPRQHGTKFTVKHEPSDVDGIGVEYPRLDLEHYLSAVIVALFAGAPATWY